MKASSILRGLSVARQVLVFAILLAMLWSTPGAARHIPPSPGKKQVSLPWNTNSVGLPPGADTPQ